MPPEEEELLRKIASARWDLDNARRAMYGRIRRALEAGLGPSAIARASGYTREYVAKIRDGKGPKGA